MSILFWLRKNQKNRKGESPVWCTLTMDSHKTELSCNISIRETDWNQIKQMSEGLLKDYQNSHLEQISLRLLQIKIQLDAIGKPFTPKDVKERYLGKKIQHPTFLQQYDLMVSEKKIKNPNSKPASFKKYQIFKKNFVSFLNSIGQIDIYPNEFSPTLMDAFEIFLYANLRSCCKNHAFRHLETIKAVQKFCIRKDSLHNLAATEYITTRERSKNILFLKSYEVRKLETFDFNSKPLEIAADLFMFQCWTGFAYVDLYQFNYDTDIELINGKEWIIKQRQKTEILPQLPLFPKAKDILEKYDHKLPLLTNQNYNDHLKVIAGYLNLKFNLTTHIARKTAGTLWLNNGFL